MHLLYEGGSARVSPGPGAPFVIGRSSEASLILVDQAVSRRHATILVEGARALLADEGSTNGTLVNGRRLAHGELLVLSAGDVIDIGASRLVYGVEEPGVSGATTTVLRRERSEAARPLADLLWDAHARADSAENRRDRAVFAEIFASSTERGLADTLALVRRGLDASVVALFIQVGATLRVAAREPAADGAPDMGGLAQRAWATRTGRLVGGVVSIERRDARETCADPYYSAVAVPLESLGELQGVLTAERMRRERFADGDLELAARLGERLIELLVRERCLAGLLQTAIRASVAGPS